MAYRHVVASHQERYAESMIRDFRAPEVFDPPAQNRGDLGERPGHLAFLIPTCTLVASGSARLSTSGWLRVPFIKER